MVHRSACDLQHPGSPSATATCVRHHGDRLGYLVLADSPLILDGDNDLILDDGGPAELIRRTRGAEERDPDGRWPRGKRHGDATAVYCRLDSHPHRSSTDGTR